MAALGILAFLIVVSVLAAIVNSAREDRERVEARSERERIYREAEREARNDV